MSKVIPVHDPGSARSTAPQLKAFLELGFRPLYIAGCAWALVSILLWIFTPQVLTGPLGGVAWHAHEMLWGFVATIAVGFLLTASATWTGFNPLKGWGLALACLLWIVARAGFLAGGPTAFMIACAAETAFFALAAITLARVMLKGKSKRNYGIPVLVAGLGGANILFLHAARSGDYIVLMHYFEQGLICMAIIALLVARRVIPFFAMRATPGLQIPMLTRSGHVQLAAGVIAIATGLASLAIPTAVLLTIIGVISLYQLIRWKPHAVLSNPLLWILYVGYALMGIGLLLAAAHVAGLGSIAFARAATHIHVIGMGGFAVLIIGMVTRTALGHLGRPLVLDKSMVVCYWLMLAAVVFRLAALWPSGATLMLLHTAAALWILLFALYLWRFTPMLIRPRP